KRSAASFPSSRRQIPLSAHFPFALEQAPRKKSCHSAPSRVLKLRLLDLLQKKRSGDSSGMLMLMLANEPPGKLLCQIGSKIHSKFSARIEPQRIAVPAIK